MRTLGLVPAAGSAERFGGPKLLADVGGEPLLRRTLASLSDGGVDEIVLVLSAEGVSTVRAAIGDPARVRVVVNEDPSRGMFSSLQAGLAGARGDAVAVLPGDMPFVDPATIRMLLQVFTDRDGIVSPRFAGKRGHPLVLPAALRAEILAAAPTSTLHTIIAAHREERIDVDVDDPGVLRDVDTRADLAHA
ncbi:NTP transferase domain-containing protein [soil metagenome]